VARTNSIASAAVSAETLEGLLEVAADEAVTAGTPGKQLSPEILMGVMQSLTAVEGIWDSAASILPDLASDFAMLKDLQQRVAAKIVTKGGTAPSTATGLNFPGGGFDRGV
jgi:hypothetical protein